MAFHSSEIGRSNHVIHAFTYANAAARAIASGMSAADVGKIALQTDTSQYFVLQNHSPLTWNEVTLGAIHYYTYADAAARNAASGLTANDIGKIARQTDTEQFFILQDNSPLTWAEITPVTKGLPAISSSSGNVLITSDTYVDVNNLSVVVTTTGRPVKIYLVSDASGNLSSIEVNGSSTLAVNTYNAAVKAIRDGATNCGEQLIGGAFTVSTGTATSAQNIIPSSSLVFYDNPTAGTYTYKIQARRHFFVSGANITIKYSKLIVEEY